MAATRAMQGKQHERCKGNSATPDAAETWVWREWQQGYVHPNYAQQRVQDTFSTPWTRYSLNTGERSQKLEGNMKNDVLENSVTSNLENLVLLKYLSLE